MPATPAYIRVLTAERLRAERPVIAVPAENKEVHAKRNESKLTGIINQAPQLPAQANLPQSSTIIKLDDGRILISDAIALFGWAPGTSLSWSVIGGQAQAIETDGSKIKIDSSGRILIPSTIRKRLGIKSNGSVLVSTDSTPTHTPTHTPTRTYTRYYHRTYGQITCS